MFVGPPPRPPEAPKPVDTLPLLQLLLCLITFGLWIPIWLLIAGIAALFERRAQRRHAEELAAYRVAYDDWQRLFHQEYGTPPTG